MYVVDTNVGIDSSVPGALDALEEAGESASDEVIQQAEAAGVDSSSWGRMAARVWTDISSAASSKMSSGSPMLQC